MEFPEIKQKESVEKRMNRLKKNILRAIAAIGLSPLIIPISHGIQIYGIEKECEAIRKRSVKTLDPDAVVSKVLAKARVELQSGKGGLGWVLGDFSTENGKARCGGYARFYSEKLSAEGFQTDICLTVANWQLHYYCQAQMDGETWELTP